MTPWDDLLRQHDRQPGAAAVRVGPAAWSYRDLVERSERLARGLLARGVGPGKRVSVHAANAPGLVAAYYACWRVGAIACPLNTRYAAPELGAVLRRLAPVVHLADAERGAVLDLLGPEDVPDMVRVVAGGDAASAGWEGLVAPVEGVGDGAGPALPDLGALDPDAPAVLLSTSGTTGQPKFVVHTARTLGASAAALVQGDRDTGPALLVYPLVHAGGLLMVLSFLRRAELALLPASLTPAGVLDEVAGGAARVFTTPALAAAMVAAQRAEPRDVSALRSCTTGGDVCPPAVQDDVEETFGVSIRQTWGCSEVTGALAAGRVAGPVSTRVAGTEVRIVDEGGADVARGDVGELLVRHECVSPGYWQGPGRVVDGPVEGWFATGDLFRAGQGDELWFVTRKKLVIVRGGSNVAPAEVEQVLERHPRVRAAAVVGVPDEELGQRVAAVVEVDGHAGAQQGEELSAQLVAHAGASLAAYKVPERVVVVDALPRGAMGKVERAALAELLDTPPQTRG